MAVVSPFRGIRYDLSRVEDLSRVVTQPYDVISPEEQRELHERHPRNIVRIDFGLDRDGDGPAENKYTRAAAWFREWLAEGTLAQDRSPAFYVYEQEFSIPGRGRFLRKGFLGALRLSAFGEGTVFPHERTHSGPKRDRLSLLRATEANLSPIFALYSDPEDSVGRTLRAARGSAPDGVAVDDLGVTHRIWKVDDPEAVAAAAAGMRDRKVFIADGHHRYETALAYRDEMRKKLGGPREDAAWEHVMMFLCNMDDEGIVILPTHRGIHEVPGFSEEAFASRVGSLLPAETRVGSPEEAMREVAERGAKAKTIGWSAGGGRYHLVAIPDPARLAADRLSRFPGALRTLDVVFLHGLLFEEMLGIDPEAVTAGRFVTYYKEPSKAASDLASGRIQAAFFLNPVTMEEFRNVSLSGHVLPQKTTFFYPKILTGLVIFPVGEDAPFPG
ncbi:MAG: DUF1015 domain-containing protein [Deltaproteobacteria bacterium]